MAEPRARAGKNVGKLSFTNSESKLSIHHSHSRSSLLIVIIPKSWPSSSRSSADHQQTVKSLLLGNGDVSEPLPETTRVLDEILTDFMQSLAYEATRAAHYSGRQKIKYEDFEFAFRKNPTFIGRVQETFDKQKMIKKARDIGGEEGIMKEAVEEEKKREKNEAKNKRPRVEEELGEADDDVDGETSAVGSVTKK